MLIKSFFSAIFYTPEILWIIRYLSFDSLHFTVKQFAKLFYSPEKL
ncbi:Uncharacterized protein dnm_062040 [Desulfonema magnum]|uniref:Uncharacterized protein n=1 Tax=Desulfonema magnum TaxID=45655 RepID=A0A975BRA6_9BACT|nr:Uncharacterized protein dnm_062040 [Desulfonema magnum]